MNRFIISIIVACFCTGVAAAPKYDDYKCYVIDTVGEDRVHFFQLQRGLKLSQQKKLVGRAILDSFGNTIATVDEVKECIGMYDEFVSPVAKEIDNVQGH